MTFKLEIECDGEAFGTKPGYELSKLLMEIALKVLNNPELDYGEVWSLRDANGNRVGHARVEYNTEGR